MSMLPPAQTPLNQHSLASIELWLNELGAEKSKSDPCLWTWEMPSWSAEIRMDSDELKVMWIQDGRQSKYSFSYGLPRNDVHTAIIQGP